MTRRPAINAVERSGQPARIVGGKRVVEILKFVSIHDLPPPAGHDPATVIKPPVAGEFSEWFA